MTTSMTLTIQDFSALMTNQQDDSVIVQILRRITEKQEAVIAAVGNPPATPDACWGGWH